MRISSVWADLALVFSELHWRLSCASATLFREVRGTENGVLQKVQTPTAGIVPSHLITLRLRFGIDTVSHMLRDGSTLAPA